MIYDLILDFLRISFFQKNKRIFFSLSRYLQKRSIREIIQSYSRNVCEAGIF